MPETIKIKSPRIDATLAADTANSADRTVQMQFYSGAPVSRYSFARGGEYTLSFSMNPDHVRLDSLNNGRAPLLESHMSFGTDSVLGVIEKGWLQDGKGMATARFAKGDPTADSVWNKVEQKILRNVSMGVMIHKMKDTTKEGDAMRSYLAVDWEPQEISVVPIGADPGAQMLSREQLPEIEVVVLRADRAPEKEIPMNPEVKDGAGDPANAKQNPDPVTATDEQLNSARIVGMTAEQGRITGILKVARVCHLPMSLAEKHVAANTSLEDFRRIAIDEQALEAAKVPIRDKTRPPEILNDEVEKRRDNMTGALLERFAPGMWSHDADGFRYVRGGGQRFHEGARAYASCSLLDIAKECLSVQGIRWQNKSRTEIAQLAFQSSSDFPNILADVAGKSLRAGFEMVQSQWRLIASRRSASDFKDQKELTLDASARLEKVPESGEFKHGKLIEGKETYKLSTYGKIISITRRAIINDDLGAFTRTPQLMGQEVAMLEADTVWGVVTANGNLADNVALFEASTHKNLIAGAAAISETSISANRVLMMTQKSTGAKVLNIEPRYIVVPAAISLKAEQYTSTNYVAAQQSSINPFAGRLIPIVEARLDAVDANDWYLFADPNSPNGTVLVYAYLDGQEGPYTETMNGFEVDGVQIKVRHDFGAAAVDYRGATKQTGA
jgi:hypothetical protein